MKSILLVEDDPEISQLLELHLNAPLYSVNHYSLGEEALNSLKLKSYELVILDIMLPDIDGIEICKRIRTAGYHTPIMMLTSRDEELDKVLALELGADDYVCKPFGIRELLARVKAILRRAETVGVADVVNMNEIIFKDIHIDIHKRKATIANKRLDLTPKEFDLLVLMANNKGKTFSRLELLEQVWGYSFSGYEHTVTAHINRLRIKIEPDLNNPIYILTSWGVGYRFADENKTA